jgi:hypothetical protein
VRGRVGYDVELRRFSLDRGDERFPVVWPAGTVGSDDGPAVVLPDSNVHGLAMLCQALAAT